MTGRGVGTALSLLVFLGFLGEAGRNLVTPRDRPNTWLQVLVAQQLADTFGREVQLGAIEGNLVTRVVAHDLAVAEERLLAEGAILQAKRLELRYDLVKVLRGEVAPAASIDLVRLDGAYARLVRDESGQLNLARILPKGKPAPSEERFRGKVQVTDSELSYEDRSILSVNGRPLALELGGVEGEVSLARADWIEASLSAWERLGRFAHASASVEMRQGTGFVWIDADLHGVDVPWSYNFFAASEQLDMRSGRADLSGTVAVVPRASGDTEVALACEGALRDASARVQALNGALVEFEGAAGVTLDGIEVHRLEAQVGATRVRAEGFLADFAEPVLELCFEGEAMRPAQLVEMFPDLAENLAGIEIDSPLRVAGRMVGSLENGDLSLTASLPGTVSYADAELGRAQVEGLQVALQLLDLSEPTVQAQADAAQVRVPDLAGLEQKLSEQLPGPWEVAPMDDVDIAVLWSGDNPVVHTDLAIPRITAGDLELAQLSAHAAMAGMVVSLEDLHAEAVGAGVNGDALLDLRDAENPWACFAGDVSGLELARLQDLPGLEQAAEVSGTVDGQVVASYENGKAKALGEVVVAEPSYQEYGVDAVYALVQADADGLEVQRGQVGDAAFDVWVRGVVPWQGDIALRFSAADVDLADVAQRFDVEELRGQAYLTGAATGSLQEPQFEVTAQAYEAAWKDYEVEAVAVRARGNLDAVELDSLYASSGRLVVSVEGSVTEIDAESRDGELDGRLRVAGPIDEYARTLAGIEELDLEAAARLEAQIGGTLRHPTGSGQLFARYARYETLASDAALMMVRLDGDTLDIGKMRTQVGDAVVSGSASITSIWDEPVLAAKLSAQNIVLQDLVLWQEVGLELSGRVDLPYCDLQGPLDDLQGLAQIEARDLVLGDEEIGSVSAWVVLNDELLLLRRTTVGLAGGNLAVQGQYSLADREILPSKVELEGISMSRLLSAAQPVAKTFAEPQQGKTPLHWQLARLAMRLGGTMDGSVSLSGKLPPIPRSAGFEPARVGEVDEDEGEDTPADLLASLAGEVELKVADASYDGKKLPEVEARAQIAGRKLTGIDIAATDAEALITASGDWDLEGEVSMLVEVYALDLARQGDWIPASFGPVGGQLNLTVQVTGPHEAPNLLASVDVIDAERYGARFDLVSAPVITVDGQKMDIDSLELRHGDEQIFVDGQIPFTWEPLGLVADGPLRVVARTENANLGFFPPMIARLIYGEEAEGRLLSELEAQGALNSQVEITGSLAHPQLHGALSLAEGQVALPGLGDPIEDIALEAKFSRLGGETLFELTQLYARVDSTTLDVYGRAQLATFAAAALHRNEYDFTARIASPSQVFGGGVTMANVGGEIQLHTIDRGRQLVTVDALGGEVGGGRVFLNGSVALESFLPSRIAANQFNLALRVDRVRTKYSHVFSGMIDGEVVARTPAPDEPVGIAGALEISHATIRVPRAKGKAEGELRGMGEDFPAPSFDVAVLIGPDVRVEGGGVVAPLQPTEYALLFSGTPQQPVLQGRIEVQQGEASVPGGVLQIEGGGIQYMVRPAFGVRKPPVKLAVEGRVWGTARRMIPSAVVNGREVGPVEITLEVSGTLPANILITARSTPPMAEEEIYALLGTQPFLGGLGGEGDLADMMSKQFLSALGTAFRHYIFQPFEEELKEMLGLAIFEMNFAFDQPLEVKVGRYLVKDLLVTYQRSLTGDEEVFDLEISYKIQDEVEVSYQTDETDEDKLLLEYVRSF